MKSTTPIKHFMQPQQWFYLLFVLLLWHATTLTTIQAQSDDKPGTIPNGTVPGDKVIYLPIVAHQETENPIPTPAPRVFDLIPIAGAPTDRPAVAHPDLNLSVRSYIEITGELELIDVNGDTDTNAPQFVGIFAPPRLPAFTALYQVYDWDWNCLPDGCRGEPLIFPAATLLAIATTPGEALHIPTRNPNIYGGGYKAMVLYAESTRITFAYTRDDTAAIGYLVHMEDILINPALLSLYEASNAAGRTHLPALRHGESFATAAGTSIKVAIRDTGMFMDPRARKDWWMGYLVE